MPASHMQARAASISSARERERNMALSYYRIRHSIPGRMRVKSFLMKKDPARCTTVSDALKKMRGILAVTSNPVVGSAVILYEQKVVMHIYFQMQLFSAFINKIYNVFFIGVLHWLAFTILDRTI